MQLDNLVDHEEQWVPFCSHVPSSMLEKLHGSLAHVTPQKCQDVDQSLLDNKGKNQASPQIQKLNFCSFPKSESQLHFPV